MEILSLGEQSLVHIDSNSWYGKELVLHLKLKWCKDICSSMIRNCSALVAHHFLTPPIPNALFLKRNLHIACTIHSWCAVMHCWKSYRGNSENVLDCKWKLRYFIIYVNKKALQQEDFSTHKLNAYFLESLVSQPQFWGRIQVHSFEAR